MSRSDAELIIGATVEEDQPWFEAALQQELDRLRA